MLGLLDKGNSLKYQTAGSNPPSLSSPACLPASINWGIYTVYKLEYETTGFQHSGGEYKIPGNVEIIDNLDFCKKIRTEEKSSTQGLG